MSEGEDTPRTWQLRWGGHVYAENDLTIGDAETLEDILGMSWLQINPIRSARQARVIVAHMVSQRTTQTYDDVLADVRRMPVTEFLRDVWELVEVDTPGSYTDGFPPVPAGERSTPTS